MCLTAQHRVGLCCVSGQGKRLPACEIVADQFDRAVEAAVPARLAPRCGHDVLRGEVTVQFAGELVCEIGGHQVGLCDGERDVPRAEESVIDSRLAHRLSLARIELPLPGPAEAGDPVAVLEIECPEAHGIAAVEFLCQFDADVVVHVIMLAVFRARHRRRTAAALLPADSDAFSSNRRREQPVPNRQRQRVTRRSGRIVVQHHEHDGLVPESRMHDELLSHIRDQVAVDPAVEVFFP